MSDNETKKAIEGILDHRDKIIRGADGYEAGMGEMYHNLDRSRAYEEIVETTGEKKTRSLTGKIAGGIGLVLLALLASRWLTGSLWGSRGVKTAYKFHYLGKLAAVKYEDRIMAPDHYWIEIEGKPDKIKGPLTADDGRVFDTGLKGYSVK